MKTLLLCLLLCSTARAGTDDGTLAINCAFHGGLGYMVGSTISDKYLKAAHRKNPWDGTVETIMAGLLFSLVWDAWRPETDSREYNMQMASLQVMAQVGLRW